MIGSLIAERVIYRELSAHPDVSADVGERIYGLNVVPPGASTPAVLFYMPSSSTYDGFTELLGADDINGESLQFDVVCVCEGTSHAPIRRAFRGQLAALSGRTFDETDEDGRTYSVTFTARGETPLPTRVTGDRFMKALGVKYDVEISRT